MVRLSHYPSLGAMAPAPVPDMTTTGPILRISPHELHVSDPAFFETLYSYEGRWHKYDWAVNAWAAKYATIFTADHELHKARRQPLNPFFSKSKVAGRQSLIWKHIQKLSYRLSGFATSGKVINLGAATTALTRDVANDFVLNKSYNSLDREDFDIAQLIASHGAGSMWRLSKHLRWVAPTMRSVPVDWMIRFGDQGMKAFFSQLKARITPHQFDLRRLTYLFSGKHGRHGKPHDRDTTWLVCSTHQHTRTNDSPRDPGVQAFTARENLRTRVRGSLHCDRGRIRNDCQCSAIDLY